MPTLLFSRTGNLPSHLNCSTHRFPRFSPRTSCPLVPLAVFSLVFIISIYIYKYNEHSQLLNSYLIRIGRIENSLCSACGHRSQDISHFILHCQATNSLRRTLFGDSLSLFNLWSRPEEVSRLLGLHGLPTCPIPRKGSGNNNKSRSTPQFLHLG